MNTIVLSGNGGIREFLKRKLMQYLSRMYNVHESEDHRRDASYKACIVSKLLNKGEVEYTMTHYALNLLSNGTMDSAAFDEAWKVIKDYNETGGKQVVQRTDQTIRPRA